MVPEGHRAFKGVEGSSLGISRVSGSYSGSQELLMVFHRYAPRGLRGSRTVPVGFKDVSEGLEGIYRGVGRFKEGSPGSQRCFSGS